jgi:hypothetical protein
MLNVSIISMIKHGHNSLPGAELECKKSKIYKFTAKKHGHTEK